MRDRKLFAAIREALDEMEREVQALEADTSAPADLQALPVGTVVLARLLPQRWHRGPWEKTAPNEWRSHAWRAVRTDESMSFYPTGVLPDGTYCAVEPVEVIYVPTRRRV